MKLLQKSLLGFVIACMIITFGSVVPAGAASDGSDAVLKVTLPYTQIYDADSTRTDDTFKYQIVPVNGAPAPQDNVDGVYYFIIKGKPDGQVVKGNVDLRITFAKPGEYKYDISSAKTGKNGGIKYDKTKYTAHVYVKNAGNGLALSGVVLTSDGSSGKKASMEFNPSYSAKAVAEKERTASSPDGNGQVRNVDQSANNAAAQQNRNTDAAADDTATDREPTALETIKDAVLPKADPKRDYWSLMNLLAVIMTVAMGIILFARYMGRIDTPADEYIIRREGKLRLLGIVPAAVSAVVFFSVEDFGDKMGMTDEWTPFMVIALLVETGICALVYKVYDGKNDQQIKSASA